MPRQKKEKDVFKDLEDEFKNEVNSKNRDELKALVAKVTLDYAAFMEAQEDDDDYHEAKEKYDTAKFPYTEAKKQKRLKIKFIRQTLKGMGAL